MRGSLFLTNEQGFGLVMEAALRISLLGSSLEATREIKICMSLFV
jgi:hypothetical protein